MSVWRTANTAPDKLMQSHVYIHQMPRVLSIPWSFQLEYIMQNCMKFLCIAKPESRFQHSPSWWGLYSLICIYISKLNIKIKFFAFIFHFHLCWPSYKSTSVWTHQLQLHQARYWGIVLRPPGALFCNSIRTFSNRNFHAMESNCFRILKNTFQ